jgi:hypothetical protein
MSRDLRFTSWLLAACVVGAWTTASAQSTDRTPTQPVHTEVFSAQHPVIRASLNRLAARSSAWRDAVAELAKTGRRAVIVTPDQVRVVDRDGQPGPPFDPSVLAEVQPIADAQDRVATVLVVVNVDLLATVHARSQWSFDLDADLDRILAHEVYGHAVPYLLSGHLSGKCADPVPGQRPTDACAIQRENAVRSQLGLGQRIDSGLHGLALARRHH